MKKIKENRLVVGDAEWAKDLPKWLLEEIKTERLLYGLASITNPDCQKIGDAEVVAYLMTASLRAPMLSEQNEVYIYLSARLMKKRGVELEGFMKEKLKQGLTDYEERELKSLKFMIYDKRGGEVQHPILNIMRAMKIDNDNPQKKLNL